MPLDINALVTWIAITIAFIVTIALLYSKLFKAKRDESRDETTTY
ncbi:MAG: hypothetical protein QXU32_03420 [Nitrososphaerales archaeon]